MALRALMLRKKIDSKKSELESLRAKDSEFEKREAELEKAIEEAETEEEKTAVEEEVEKFDSEKKEHEKEKSSLEDEISGLEKDLEEAESEQPKPESRSIKPVVEKRGAEMGLRTRFHGMTIEQREAFFSRDDVKSFVEQVRSIGIKKRAVTGAELTIPEVVLELIHEDIEQYSKLYKYVNVKPVKGKARQNVMGKVPEAIWTEMVGKINEVEISFADIEVDGYKVAAFVAIPNSTLEDSDIALGSEIIDALGKGIGLALDKAIVFGKIDGKMPKGIVPSIAASDYNASNIIKIDSTKKDLDLFREIIKASGNMKKAEGEKVWVMNNTTHMKILAASLGVNSAAAITAGMNDTMPVLGGKIEELEFMPDDVIVGGYGKRYLLAERAGTSVNSSSEYQFIEDNTVYKGTARYDGKPVFVESFIAIGIDGKVVSGSEVTFAEDKANAASS